MAPLPPRPSPLRNPPQDGAVRSDDGDHGAGRAAAAGPSWGATPSAPPCRCGGARDRRRLMLTSAHGAGCARGGAQGGRGGHGDARRRCRQEGGQGEVRCAPSAPRPSLAAVGGANRLVTSDAGTRGRRRGCGGTTPRSSEMGARRQRARGAERVRQGVGRERLSDLCGRFGERGGALAPPTLAGGGVTEPGARQVSDDGLTRAFAKYPSLLKVGPRARGGRALGWLTDGGGRPRW